MHETGMRIIGILFSVALIVLVLIDGFETILQPRRVTHRFRYAGLYYRCTWTLWRGLALRLAPGRRREAFLSLFAPVSLLGIFVTWVVGLIVGFGMLHWSLATPMHDPDRGPALLSYLYLSGTTFFTLGYGDVTPLGTIGRALAVAESGLGFGFLAVIISYLPVLFQAYSERELTISLLDARGGSPPAAGQVLLRLARSGNLSSLDAFLKEWERWAAAMLGSHLSFPVLSYYRSQHDNQSWLATLVTILDTCSLLIAEAGDGNVYQAQLTFAMARHAAVDLCLVLNTPPTRPRQDRLTREQLLHLRQLLQESRLNLRTESSSETRLTELRELYEPFVAALAHRFLFSLPPILSEDAADNWQRSAWTRRSPGIGQLPPGNPENDHFA